MGPAHAMNLFEVIESKRKQKQIKDIQEIFAPLAGLNSNVLDEITSLFRWTQVYNDLDVFLDKEMTQQDPMANMKSDLVFERVLGHSIANNEEHWKETSECWICNCHDALRIEVNEFTCVQDPEYSELLTLSSVLHEEALANPEKKAEASELIPAYQQVFTALDG